MQTVVLGVGDACERGLEPTRGSAIRRLLLPDGVRETVEPFATPADGPANNLRFFVLSYVAGVLAFSTFLL